MCSLCNRLSDLDYKEVVVCCLSSDGRELRVGRWRMEIVGEKQKGIKRIT